ncbi:hypothetical protein FAI40_08165 [Acetobacteraceae bacterium]|nr:hypothetical protein FAI40_08165 [Acetobacteraceae bacterium]
MNFPQISLQEIEDAFEKAQMLKLTKEARFATDKGKLFAPEKREAPIGWHSASDEELSFLGLDRKGDLEFPEDPNSKIFTKTHYFSQIFISDSEPKKYVLAHPGTDPLNLQDVWQNVKNAFGGDSFYYRHSREIAKTILRNHPDLNLEAVGHSLGGGESADIAKATGIKATTFAAMGPNQANVPDGINNPPVTNFYMEGEFAQVLPSIGFPKLEGQQIPLPQAHPEALAQMNSQIMMTTPNPLQMTAGCFTRYLFAFHKHSLDRTIQGLKALITATKKAEDAVSETKLKITNTPSFAFGLPPVCEGDIHLCPMPFHFATPIIVPGVSILIAGRPAAFSGCKSACAASIVGTGHLKINGRRTVLLGDISSHGGVCSASPTSAFVRIRKG